MYGLLKSRLSAQSFFFTADGYRTDRQIKPCKFVEMEDKAISFAIDTTEGDFSCQFTYSIHNFLLKRILISSLKWFTITIISPNFSSCWEMKESEKGSENVNHAPCYLHTNRGLFECSHDEACPIALVWWAVRYTAFHIISSSVYLPV